MLFDLMSRLLEGILRSVSAALGHASGCKYSVL